MSFPLLALLLAASGPAPRADDADAEKARAAETLEMAAKEARSYAFRPIGGGEAYALRPEPVLKWTQPVYGTVYGHVFVWTAKGRPQVIGSFQKWYQPFTHISDEFHSLSTGGLAATLDGEPSWTSEQPGVEFQPIPDAPEPAATPAARLRQMRDLARDFSGRETDRKGEDRDLRILPQPLHRYEAPEGEVVDGALFAIAHGTDPDAVLLVEARRGDGAPRWQYALARMTTSALRVGHKGREVWNVPLIGYGRVYSHKEPYTTFRFDGAKATPPSRANQP